MSHTKQSEHEARPTATTVSSIMWYWTVAQLGSAGKGGVADGAAVRELSDSQCAGGGAPPEAPARVALVNAQTASWALRALEGQRASKRLLSALVMFCAWLTYVVMAP
jgi:hypothetical protein